MDEGQGAAQQGIADATPIFNVYRRGYDPEQVDRYVNEQQRRLDEAIHRASESERKLAAAVGQLRELHRRVAVYESEARSAQPPALDTLGERVQRILQEAWEGAYNLRQEAEREVNELREQAQAQAQAQREQAERDVEELRQVASKEAADLVDEATKRALAMRDEMDRRRQAYLERVEQDRQRAVSQITFLYDQRQLAIGELARLQASVQATIGEMVQSPIAKTLGGIAESTEPRAASQVDVGGFLVEPDGDVPGDGDVTVLVEAESDGEDDRSGTEIGDVGTGGFSDDTLFVEADQVPEPSGGSRFFEQIIRDPESAASDETILVAPAEEIPTGPMDAIDLGYSARSSRGTSSEEGQLGDVSDEAEGPVQPAGGVYDAEAEGWS